MSRSLGWLFECDTLAFVAMLPPPQEGPDAIVALMSSSKNGRRVTLATLL
jgi:hypothetical protein